MALASMAALLAVAVRVVLAAPAIFWASDPIGPNQTALVVGEGFGEQPTVELLRLPDARSDRPPTAAAQWPGRGEAAEAIQPADSAVKFVVPASAKPGVFAYRITGAQGAAWELLNRPTIWWVQGDLILHASPGGWVRAFGKNLAWPQGEGTKTVLHLRGPKSVTLAAEGDGYSVRAALPADLPVGQYEVLAHNGRGGDLAWSAPAKLVVERPPAWPTDVFDVKGFGALGNGRADDTAAVEAALKKAEANGGGVVYFPRGRYLLNATLHVPPKTVLRGEREDLAMLYWGDGSDGWKRTVSTRLPCVIQGTHEFGVEDLFLWFVNANNGILMDRKGPDAGNVFIRRVRMQWIMYGGYLDIVEANDIFKQTAADGGAGSKGMLAYLTGKNVEISDCDLESSGSVFWLENVQGARVTNNRLRIGRLGYFRLVREMGYRAPICLHVEFDWTEKGKTKTREALVKALRDSVRVLKQWLEEAQG